MNIKEFRENVGRCKTAYARKKNVEAVAALIKAMRSMGNGPYPTDARSALREAVQILNNETTFTEILKKPLSYQPGQEQALFVSLVHIYKAIAHITTTEDRATALARKIKIDKAYNEGLKNLEQKKVSEADACFAEAIKHYKDEHSLFALIGKSLMEAEEVRRAYPYLKKGVEVAPNNLGLKEIYDKCCALRQAKR